jgi:Fe-S cluster biogenesis protein NfuA
MIFFNINIKPTNHPDIVKFEADKFLLQREGQEFNNIDEAKNSPLAQQLFYLPFVKKIYIAQNFVAIEKYDIVEWKEVQQEVADAIEGHLNNGGAVIKEDSTSKKMPATVYVESTPNPSVLKFIANKKLVLQTTEFKNSEEAKNAPMAQQLFQFPFVKEIFLDENFISITKYDSAEWEDITAELREFIRQYIEDGKEILKEEAVQPKLEDEKKGTGELPKIETENLDDVSKEIVEILEEYVKPAVASDGGNIKFESYNPEDRRVKVILQGACSGCPSSTVTLKNGIEQMLREMLKGKVQTVEAVNE